MITNYHPALKICDALIPYVFLCFYICPLKVCGSYDRQGLLPCFKEKKIITERFRNMVEIIRGRLETELNPTPSTLAEFLINAGLAIHQERVLVSEHHC